jgi:hypothetical protein
VRYGGERGHFAPFAEAMSRIARLRWRLARLFAPAPIIAAPFCDGPAILFSTGTLKVWIAVTTLDLQLTNTIRPLDEYATATYVPGLGSHGTFSGTVNG